MLPTVSGVEGQGGWRKSEAVFAQFLIVNSQINNSSSLGAEGEGVRMGAVLGRVVEGPVVLGSGAPST